MALTLAFELTADASGFTGVVRGSAEELEQLQGAAEGSGRAGEQAGRQAERGARGVREFGRESSAARTAADRLRQAVAALAGAFALGALVRLADEQRALRSQIARTTESQAEQNARMRELHAIAQDADQALSQMVGLYAALDRNRPEFGATAQEITRVTRAIAEAVKIGQTSSQQQQAALSQFIRLLDMGEGSTRQLVTIMSDAPELAERIAAGLGLTVSELRRAASEGRVLSRDVFRALLDQADAISEAARRVPGTIGDELTHLRNDMLLFAEGFGDALTPGVQAISAAFREGVRESDGLAAALGTVLGGALEAVAFGLRVVNDHATVLYAALGAYAGLRTAAMLASISAGAVALRAQLLATTGAAAGLQVALTALGGAGNIAGMVLGTVLALVVTRATAAERAADALSRAQRAANDAFGSGAGSADALREAYGRLSAGAREVARVSLTTALAEQERAILAHRQAIAAAFTEAVAEAGAGSLGSWWLRQFGEAVAPQVVEPWRQALAELFHTLDDGDIGAFVGRLNELSQTYEGLVPVMEIFEASAGASLQGLRDLSEQAALTEARLAVLDGTATAAQVAMLDTGAAARATAGDLAALGRAMPADEFERLLESLGGIESQLGFTRSETVDLLYSLGQLSREQWRQADAVAAQSDALEDYRAAVREARDEEAARIEAQLRALAVEEAETARVAAVTSARAEAMERLAQGLVQVGIAGLSTLDAIAESVETAGDAAFRATLDRAQTRLTVLLGLIDRQRGAAVGPDRPESGRASARDTYAESRADLLAQIEDQRALTAALGEGEDAYRAMLAAVEVSAELRRLESDLTAEQRAEIEQLLVALRAEKDAHDALADLMDEGRRLTESLRSATEIHADEVERLNELLDAGAISYETWLRGMERANETLKRATETASPMSRIFTEIGRSGERALDGIRTGSFRAADALDVLQEAIQRVLWQLTVTGPLDSLLGGLDLGGLFGGLFGGGGAKVPAAVKHGGGRMDEAGPTRMVPTALFAGAPRHHRGWLAPRERPAILMDDESVFTPRQLENADRLIRAMADRGGVEVTVIDQRSQSSPPVAVTERRRGDGMREIRMMLRDEMRSAVNAGELDGAMGRSFGLRRQGR